MTRHSLSAVSFRDPGGFVYEDQGCILRQVNFLAREHYDQLMKSGLYRELTERRLLIAHDEVDALPRVSATAYRVIRPEPVSLISYPFEWSFSQYKDAALLTLAVERHALRRGMSLKDCSAYNVQFHEGQPILIDTLSLEQYHEGWPWVAYRQFCQHFLAPLALMSLTDIRLGQLCRTNLDGIPLDLATRLLPWRSRVRFGLSLHPVYIIRRIEEVIDQILARSKVPRILILQADHGSGLRLNMQSKERTDLRERMGILNAYYFPNRDYRGLYQDITPVNSFRVVLNTLFGARFEILPDRSNYSTWSEPYQFMDVTEAVRSPSRQEPRQSGSGNSPSKK